ncbi:hypothetical protein [Aeromicrobium sp. Leaf350]|uniref:hypothetical protein n=1 Tax=Aeromicrobium sp. Leaf350 TaxID=2876565 RepID=UPI001E46FCAE|nr:hypothetical protein [Aeromicrobium sp. Leaf350]
MRLDAFVELASGVDAFYLTGACVLPIPFLEDLAAARADAGESGQATDIHLGDARFAVSGRGIQKYAFALEHSNGILACTPSQSLPPVYVQPRASFIHAVGIEAATAWFTELVEGIAGTVRWNVSRVDLFMDSQGWDLDAEDRDQFVCRARDRQVYERDAEMTGLAFGSGKSVMARIYDKTEESRKKGTDWWPTVWGESFVPTERVLRVEFQVRRQVIRQVGLSAPDDVLRELPRLWAYLTDEWLTFRSVSSDATRSRWPLSPEWTHIQQAELRGSAIGLERVYEQARAGSIRQLLPALQGYLTSAGALLGAGSLEDTMSRVRRLLALEEDRTGIAFGDRLSRKALELGLA